MKHSFLLIGLGLAGCGVVTDEHHMQAPNTGGATQGPTSIARCDASKPFNTPTLLAGVNTADDELGFALTPDELTAFVDRQVQGSVPTSTLLTAQRSARMAAFAMASNDPIATVAAEDGDELAATAADGYLFYFGRYLPSGVTYLFAGIRDNLDDAFYDVAVTVDDTTVGGASPTLSGDASTLYWVDSTDSQLRSATRNGFQEQFTGAQVASTMQLDSPVVSADGLTLYYSAQGEIMVSTRTSATDVFGPGVPVPNVNSPVLDAPMSISADGCVLYLSSDRAGGVGGFDIWQAQRAR